MVHTQSNRNQCRISEVQVILYYILLIWPKMVGLGSNFACGYLRWGNEKEYFYFCWKIKNGRRIGHKSAIFNISEKLKILFFYTSRKLPTCQISAQSDHFWPFWRTWPFLAITRPFFIFWPQKENSPPITCPKEPLCKVFAKSEQKGTPT